MWSNRFLIEDVEMLDLKELLNKKGVIFSFSGTVSQSVLTNIAGAIEEELVSMDKMDNKTIRSILVIFVELMQNIMCYSKEKTEQMGSLYESLGIALIGYSKSKNKYYVGSANFISPDQESVLREKIDSLSLLDHQEVKELYKELRRSGRDKHQRGAGLGFLEMAKKSSEPFDYKITPISNDESFFEILIYV